MLELTPVEAVACCSPLTREPLTADAAERIAPLLKAIADPVRLRLLSLVASHADGEACVCDLNDAFDLSQPTISHHLKVLHEAGPAGPREARRVGLLPGQRRAPWATWPRCSAASPGDDASRPPGGRGARRYGVPGARRGRLRHRRPAALARTTTGLQLLENSLATGAVLVALILALQPVSASFNPVVTLVERVLGLSHDPRRRGRWSPPRSLGGLVGARRSRT